MKVKAIKKGYYANKVRKIGEVFDYKDKGELPLWVTLADGAENSACNKNNKGSKASGIQDENPPQNPQENDGKKEGEEKQPQNPETKGNENPPQNQDGQTEKTALSAAATDTVKDVTDTEKQQYLELLINEGIEKNILIEDADKKTIDEQIAELEKRLYLQPESDKNNVC